MSIQKISKLGSSSRLYQIWAGILTRCENTKHPNYRLYGARGITVCKEWRTYANFEAWALANGYDPDKGAREQSIDRIDVNGNYFPSNCRWANRVEQQNNTRKNVFLSYNGETKTLAQWANVLGICYSTFMSRYSRGWSIERIASTPVHAYRKGCA